MVSQDLKIVTGEAGLRGRVVTFPGESAGDDLALIELDTGQRLLVARDLLAPRADGSYYLPLTPEQAGATAADRFEKPAASERVLPLAQEELHVGKRTVVDEKVRVHVGVQEHVESIDMPLMRETVEVERVPINRIVDAPPPTREEGDTLIIPLLEEVITVQKKLMLREEVRIMRQRTEAHQVEQVTLRREQARVERAPVVERPESESSPDRSSEVQESASSEAGEFSI